MKKYDIVAIGECLIDCVPAGFNEQSIPFFGANPGGAPANVLAIYSKLGGNTAFIGKVGKDSFGDALIKNLENANIDSSGVVADSNFNTTLAFVHLDSKGDRSFSFYRKNCADVMLKPNEVSKEMLKECDIFHFGSVSLTDEPARTATLKSAKLAKKNGAVISYDPNYRPLLWNNTQKAIKQMKKGAALADIIKVSDEELELITGETDYLKGAQILISQGVSLVFITLGAKGAFYCNQTANGMVKTFDVKTVDTTGAGDTFFGSVLWQLKGKSKEQIAILNKEDLENIVTFSNAAGSLTTTKKGAIPAMPSFNEIIDLTNKGVLL